MRITFAEEVRDYFNACLKAFPVSMGSMNGWMPSSSSTPFRLDLANVFGSEVKMGIGEDLGSLPEGDTDGKKYTPNIVSGLFV